MKIEHLALWVKDLEQTKNFYTHYFGMQCSEKYTNASKGFSSYFLSFENETTRLEIMHRADILESKNTSAGNIFGLTHFALSVGGKEKVDEFTRQFRADGYKIVGEPRTTGDGYYESVIEDVDGNWVEITE